MGGKDDEMDWLDEAIDEAMEKNNPLKVRPGTGKHHTVEVESEWIVDEETDVNHKPLKPSD